MCPYNSRFLLQLFDGGVTGGFDASAMTRGLPLISRGRRANPFADYGIDSVAVNSIAGPGEQSALVGNWLSLTLKSHIPE